ncbi:MAG: hypothetical protein JNL01_15485 [Bdellovibrionales bacterium]|nr:hypothetical protein [Bdellovibrionales bacterium]
MESSSHPTFETGATVIYALHGKCKVVGIEERTVAGQTIPFYKLEIQKSALSRSARQEPAIWLPVKTAPSRGLRAPMDAAVAEAALEVLSSREFYFPLNETWNKMLPQLEACMNREGSIGIAKVASYLHVLKKKQVVFAPEVARFSEQVWKTISREVSDALGISLKMVEERIEKGLRHKLLPHN